MQYDLSELKKRDFKENLLTVVAKRIRTFCYFIKKRTNECETAKQITKNG